MTAWRLGTALVLAGALALTGCGRDQAGGAQGGGQGEAASVSPGPAKGTIEVWAMGEEGANLPELAKAFEKRNPKADVKVTPIPWDAAHDKLSTAIAGGQTPDVALIGTTWMGEFAKTGALEPTPKNLIDSSSFFAGAWDTTVVDGTSYGVPWYVDTRVLYYRKDLAREVGFAQPPRTWAELKKLAKAYEKEAGSEWGMYLQPGQTGSWQTALPFAWQAGASLTDGSGAITLDSPAMVEGLEYYQSYFEQGLSPKQNLALKPGKVEQGFVDGTIPMFVSGPWHTALLEEQGGKGFSDKIGIATMPTKNGTGTGASFIGGGNLAVFNEAKNRDAAWKLVAWLARPEIQRQWYEMDGVLPAVQSAWDSGALANDPKLAVFGKQLEAAKSPPTWPTWEQIAAEIDTQIEKVAVAGMDPGNAAATMQQKATSIGTGS